MKSLNVYSTAEKSRIQRDSAVSIVGPVWEHLLKQRPVDKGIATTVLLERLFESLNDKHPAPASIAIYGINDLADAMIADLRDKKVRVIALFDTYKHAHYTEYQGIPVYSPDKLPDINIDALMISTLDMQWTTDILQTVTAYRPTLPLIHFGAEEISRSETLTREKAQREMDDLKALLPNLHRPVVIFVAKLVFYNQLRMSAALRERGWTTISVIFDEGNKAQHQGYFDHIFHLDPHVFLKGLEDLEGVILHTQGWMFSYHIPVIIDMFKPAHLPHVVEMMDIQTFFNPPEREQAMLPHMEKAWRRPGTDMREVLQLDRDCESHIMRHADGIVFIGTRDQQNLLRDGLPERDNAIEFPTYPLRRFFTSADSGAIAPPADGAWRLAFVGGVVPFGPAYPHAIFGDAQLLGIVRELAEQRLHVSIFNNPHLGQGKRVEERYPEYVRYANEQPFFQFKEGKPPWSLGQTVREYHYGLMLYRFDGVLIGDRHFQTVLPSKLFAYLEAGLPILVSTRFHGVCALVEQYGIGLCIEDQDILRLREILEKADYSKLRSNVVAAREELCMENQVERLMEFYSMIAADDQASSQC